MTEGRRPHRVAETIRKYIAEALTRELFDPRLKGLIVTRVDIGGDLSGARIHVRSLVDSGDAAERLEVEKAVNKAARTLRRGLGVRLGLKKTPDLRFFYDSSQDAVDRVEELLGEISREAPPRSE
jgi:ribosome-binding factor A